MECPVCCETYDKRSHIKVNCGYCNHECCRECVQSYIVSRPDIPSCMKCSHEWTRQFLMDVCTKTFINKEYKQHREQFLFEREQARLPEAQQIIQLQSQRRVYKDELERLEQLTWEKRREIETLTNRIHTRDFTAADPTTRKFVRKCPMDDCRGFLSTAWKCGVCEKHICSKCHEHKEVGHECLPDNVATAELLKRDTKSCPKCGVYITKIDGCDQMWCTDCHTAFSWRRGTIITGNVHNPHFFEARRAAGIGGRNVNDVPCGGMPTYREFMDVGIGQVQFPAILTPLVCYLEGKITNRDEPDTIYDRVSYLKGDMTELEFKRSVQRHDKAYHKQREMDDIYRMVTTTLSDLMRQVVTGDQGADDVLRQAVNILNYANDAIRAVQKKYGSKANNLIYYGFYVYKLPLMNAYLAPDRHRRLRLSLNNKRIEDRDTFRFKANDFKPPQTFKIYTVTEHA